MTWSVLLFLGHHQQEQLYGDYRVQIATFVSRKESNLIWRCRWMDNNTGLARSTRSRLAWFAVFQYSTRAIVPICHPVANCWPGPSQKGVFFLISSFFVLPSRWSDMPTKHGPIRRTQLFVGGHRSKPSSASFKGYNKVKWVVQRLWNRIWWSLDVRQLCTLLLTFCGHAKRCTFWPLRFYSELLTMSSLGLDRDAKFFLETRSASLIVHLPTPKVLSVKAGCLNIIMAKTISCGEFKHNLIN